MILSYGYYLDMTKCTSPQACPKDMKTWNISNFTFFNLIQNKQPFAHSVY